MSLPLVTRFGADPLLDLEVANKQYVDASGGGGASIVGCSVNGADSAHDLGFQPFFMSTTGNIWTTTESLATLPIFFAFTLTRNVLNLAFNNSNGVTLVGMRDDGVSIGEISIAAATSGEFDSGALSVSVASGSDCCMYRDASAASTGEFSFWHWQSQIDAA